jgi:parallel beta-helix repeat protein
MRGFLLLLLAVLLLLASCIQQLGETPVSRPTAVPSQVEPPASGDWVITGQQDIEGKTITLNGNLIVDAGGKLTLRDVNLEVNCQEDGQYKISIETSGSMYIYGSIITTMNPEYRFAFVVNGSAFEMKNSELHGVGWQASKFDEVEGVADEARGLLINTPGAVMENNSISGNTIGVILRGDNVTLKDNDLNSNDYRALDIYSSNNTISGNSFEHATTFDSNIVYMDKGHSNTITSNTFVQKPTLRWNHMKGIQMKESWNNLISDNTMDVDLPIGMFGSSNNIIRSNTLIANEAAVHVRAGVNNRIEDNDVQLEERGTRFGILLVYAHDNIVTGNNLWGPAQGGYGTIYLDHSNRNHLLNNQISVPTLASSVFLLSSKDNELSGNQVSNGWTGLFLYYQADNNNISNNSIASELYSVIIDGSSENLIYQNNFSRGIKGPYDNGDNQFDFEGRGNRWDNYQGKDSNGDGIGDVPYSLPPTGEDRHPLVNPVEIKSSLVPETKPVSFAQGPQFMDVNNINVTGEKVIENQTVVMESGTIGVQSSSSLVIRNSILILGDKGPVDIIAARGGSIHIERSIIKAAESGYGFQLIIGQDAKLEMKDSELHGASWDIGGGLSVQQAESAVIENSLITGSHLGLFLGRVGSARVLNNVFKSNYQGISVDTSSNVLVEGNTIDGYIMSGLLMVNWDKAHDIRVANNTISNGWGQGIQVVSNTLVENNKVVKGNISVTGDNCIIRGNTIESGGGIKVSGNNNLIYQNNILAKQSEDQGSSNRWDNGEQGNYWSDFAGKDANSDGIGDTPYLVPPNGIDNCPLTKPY